MKNIETKILTAHNISYGIFILLIIVIPLAFYRGFDNGLEFVKSELLKILGGLFIIACSAYLISNYRGKKSAGTKYIIETALDPYVFIFIISALLSALFSLDFHTSYAGSYERQTGFLTYVYFFFIYLLLPLILDSSRRIKNSLLIMETAAVLVALMCILEYTGLSFIDLRPQGFSRPVSTIGHPIFSAGFLILIFPFSVLNLYLKKSIITRWAIPVIIAAGIIATQTRTTYVALGIEIIIISVLYPSASGKTQLNIKKVFIKSFVILAGFLILTIILILLFPENVIMKRFLSISRIYDQPRWFLWRDSISMFAHYPFTGTGIGNYARAFENYASYQLRFSEIRVYFDNPHNNFINSFCTMGLLGGIAYLLVLFGSLRVSFKNLLKHKNSTLYRKHSLAFFSFVCGYIVFGLADFDDVNILFFFFVLLSLYKSLGASFSIRSDTSREIKLNENAVKLSAAILILFSLYNIYFMINEISAQMAFSKGEEQYSAGDINGFLKSMNDAVSLNAEEPYYKYEFASKLNIYCSGLSKNDLLKKNTLLEKAREQVIKAEVNHTSKTNCLALRSLIELSLGNEKEGLRIKDELYKIDSTIVSYRINLAVYYLNQNNDSTAIKEVNTVLGWDIKNINAFTVKVMYFLRTGNNAEAVKTCREILAIEPGNSFAERTLKELNSKK